ncbi:MAG TPA: hypothetical protein VFY97_08895, partial [Rhodanobacteraceae bacterium]|nr:hypothetical protein [Rhodanobacteraceae bacterium]
HWGLGHATRSLGLIRALVERGDAVTVLMAPGAGLHLLRSELGDACESSPASKSPTHTPRMPVRPGFRRDDTPHMATAGGRLDLSSTRAACRASRGPECLLVFAHKQTYHGSPRDEMEG